MNTQILIILVGFSNESYWSSHTVDCGYQQCIGSYIGGERREDYLSC